MTTTEEHAPQDQIGMPALLRAARLTYGARVNARLAADGYEDMPRNGSFVVSAIARDSVPLGEIIDRLGVTKQTAGQLVDTLVVRGYLDRTVDPGDRRRLILGLTDRGEGAAAVVRLAVDEIDEELLDRVGPRAISATKATLLALASFRYASHDAD